MSEKSIASPRHLKLATLLVGLAIFITGCAQPEFNKTPPTSEGSILSDAVQLTHGFDRAGEAYFSADMNWIIFQGAPKDEPQYQMYIARVMYDGADPHKSNITRLGEPVRITPEKSRNTCGFFSPDGNSILFASTAGKDDPNEPSSGYQRQGGNYRWSYPAGMEIFRADGWKGAIAAAEPGKIVDLAKHPLTNNQAYDAECAYSPDGKWISFTSNVTGDLELYAMRPDGSGVVQLTHTKGYDGGAFFSPDGKRLVYRSDRKGNDLLQIFVADIVRDRAGNIVGLTKERQITRQDDVIDPAAPAEDQRKNVAWGPFWHPDGLHIMYATSAHGHKNYELYLMRADGSHKTRITFTTGADLLPAFSPDGRYLMWCSRRGADTPPQIYVAKFKMPAGA